MSNYINENLLGTSPHASQQAEAKKLVSKWEKTGLLDGLNEEFQKSGMAVMLENQAKQLIQENSATGGVGGGGAGYQPGDPGGSTSGGGGAGYRAGTGGGLGAAGQPGSGGSAGSAGYYIKQNSNPVTWQANGTRNGSAQP